MVKHPLLLVEHFVKLLGMHHGPQCYCRLKTVSSSESVISYRWIKRVDSYVVRAQHIM